MTVYCQTLCLEIYSIWFKRIDSLASLQSVLISPLHEARTFASLFFFSFFFSFLRLSSQTLPWKWSGHTLTNWKCVLTSGDRFQWVARTGKRSLKRRHVMQKYCRFMDAPGCCWEVVKCDQKRLGGEKDLSVWEGSGRSILLEGRYLTSSREAPGVRASVPGQPAARETGAQ